MIINKIEKISTIHRKNITTIKPLNEGFDARIRYNLMVNGAFDIKKDIVLDLGCGHGNIRQYFQKSNLLYIYADIQLDVLKHTP